MDIEGFEYEVVRLGGQVLCGRRCFAPWHTVAHVATPGQSAAVSAQGAAQPFTGARPCCVQVSGFQMEDSCHFPHQISLEVHYKQLYSMTDFMGVRRAGGQGRAGKRAGRRAGRGGRQAGGQAGLLCPCAPTTAQAPLPPSARLQKRDEWRHMLWPMHELSLGELGVFFGHFANLGYAVVSRDDNPYTGVRWGLSSDEGGGTRQSLGAFYESRWPTFVLTSACIGEPLFGCDKPGGHASAVLSPLCAAGRGLLQRVHSDTCGAAGALPWLMRTGVARHCCLPSPTCLPALRSGRGTCLA